MNINLQTRGLEVQNNLPRVTGILQAAGLIDFSMVRQDVMERAQLFGTAVHKTTQLWDLKKLDINSLDPSLLPYLEGWKKFLKDYDLEFTENEIEHSLESKRYGFRGTPDRWHTIKCLLPDIKTSTQMYVATAVQTAAYQILIEENMGIKIKERLGVQLTEKGYKVEPYKDSSDKAMFLSCLSIYNWKQRHNMLDKRATS